MVGRGFCDLSWQTSGIAEGGLDKHSRMLIYEPRPQCKTEFASMVDAVRVNLSDLSAELNQLPPILALRRAILLGLIPALVFTLSATQFATSRECRGAFSRAFSNDFDRYRCAVVVRHVGTDFEIQIPMP